METNAVSRFIYSTLSADAQLTAVVGTRIFETRRPSPTTPFPCVISQLQAAGDDMMGVGPYRIWSSLLYLVRGITEQTSYEGNAAIIADRIDAALHAKSGTNVAGTVWSIVRERPFIMAEIVDGREFRHAGGLYRIQASKA